MRAPGIEVTKMGRTIRAAFGCAALATLVAGCVVHETRPLPKINATQANREIPEDELLDVGVRAFDPGVPPGIAKDERALNKERIYPDKAEVALEVQKVEQALAAAG